MFYKSNSHGLQKLLTWFTKVTHMIYKSYSHGLQKLLTWFTKVTHMVYKKLLTWFSTRLSRDTIVIFSLSRSLPIIHAPACQWSGPTYSQQTQLTGHWSVLQVATTYTVHGISPISSINSCAPTKGCSPSQELKVHFGIWYWTITTAM